MMTEDRLQLHGQSLSNVEEASGSKVRGWLDLKKIIAQQPAHPAFQASHEVPVWSALG